VTVVVAASAASTGEAGALGFLVVAGMALALFFLFRSLNKQLHKITPDAQSRKQSEPRQAGATQDGPAGGPDAR
jgi:hypothetical protein